MGLLTIQHRLRQAITSSVRVFRHVEESSVWTSQIACIFSTTAPTPPETLKKFHEPPLPSEADVVICGGGIAGCSIAYHLALEGGKKVVLLEQGR